MNVYWIVCARGAFARVPVLPEGGVDGHAPRHATRAESHGSIYLTQLKVEEYGNQTRLSMTFTGQPQTFSARLLSFLMAPMIRGSLRKALEKDLKDIKDYLESN